MTRFHLNCAWVFCKWTMALTAVWVMWGVAEYRGRLSGENGIGYWQGWQDAMIQTEYGKKAYNSEERPLWQKD